MTKPLVPAAFKASISETICEISSFVYRKSPARGRIRQRTRMSLTRRIWCTSAALGVRPPTLSALQSSSRSAPPWMAAMAEA